MFDIILAGTLGAVGGVVVNRLIHSSSTTRVDEELFDELIGKLWMKEPLPSESLTTLYRMMRRKRTQAMRPWGKIPTDTAIYMIHDIVDKRMASYAGVLDDRLNQRFDRLEEIVTRTF